MLSLVALFEQFKSGSKRTFSMVNLSMASDAVCSRGESGKGCRVVAEVGRRAAAHRLL